MNIFFLIFNRNFLTLEICQSSNRIPHSHRIFHAFHRMVYHKEYPVAIELNSFYSWTKSVLNFENDALCIFMTMIWYNDCFTSKPGRQMHVKLLPVVESINFKTILNSSNSIRSYQTYWLHQHRILIYMDYFHK